MKTQEQEGKKTQEHESKRGEEILGLVDSSRQARRGKVIVLILILLIFIPLFYLLIKKLQSQPVTEPGKLPPQKVIAQVGKETLYGQDLNYELSLYYPEAFESDQPVPEEIRQKALDQIIRNSLLLQAAADEQVIELNPAVFNNLNKDHRLRNLLINSLDEKVAEKLVNSVKGEMISIWFKNINEPKMGLETARQITRVKIEGIYQRLQSGQLTDLKSAGEEIKNDPALALIDPSYQGNAYLEFEINQGEHFFIDPKIQTEAFQLPVNQLSEILVGQDQSPGGDFYDCNFILMKIWERKLKGYQSFEDWFEQKRENYEVEIKI